MYRPGIEERAIKNVRLTCIAFAFLHSAFSQLSLQSVPVSFLSIFRCCPKMDKKRTGTLCSKKNFRARWAETVAASE